jgi:hypothetical protein
MDYYVCFNYILDYSRQGRFFNEIIDFYIQVDNLEDVSKVLFYDVNNQGQTAKVYFIKSYYIHAKLYQLLNLYRFITTRGNHLIFI